MWKTPVACEDNDRLHICLKDDFIIWRIGEWFFQETNKKNLPAPTKDPFATIWFPWLPMVTPIFKSVPPMAVYMVAIWSTLAFRAARSDCKCHEVSGWLPIQIKAGNKVFQISSYREYSNWQCLSLTS
jgi:hypothetical protein